MKHLKEFFRETQVSQILDIATGSGQFLKVLLDIFPEANFTGIDPDKESLDKAREIFIGENFSFRQMNAEKLEFEDGLFGVVTISNGLHHLRFLEKSLAEMVRVLKPNGHIIISELVSDNLNPAQENQKFYHHIKSYTDRMAGTFHHETWTKQEILDIIQQNGIKIETYFDHFDGKNFITETEPVDFWVNRLKSFIEVLKGHLLYPELLLKVIEFKKRVEKDGMLHATNVVVVGKVN